MSPVSLPICCVTGRIAGDQLACGDCDPCGAASSVPDVVKRLIQERDDFAEKYSEAMGNVDELRARVDLLEGGPPRWFDAELAFSEAAGKITDGMS